jgi:hypothetical protein
MEAELKKTGMDRYNAVFSACFSREETAETVVPDVLPDIANIIDTDAAVFLRGKEAVNGCATVTGSLEFTVIYLPDGEQCLRKLNLTLPFSASVDAPEIREGCRMVAKLSLNSAEARLLNPRKVLVRADVCSAISCFERDVLEMTEEISAEHGVQTLKKSATVSFVGSVCEKTFVLSDEYQFSAAKPALGETLKIKADVSANDVKGVGNKLVFKGTARFWLLYTASEGGQPVSEEFSTNFSQLLEMEGAGEDAVAELTIMPTGAYFEPKTASNGAGALGVELHLVAQAVCWQNAAVDYVADAYSCGYADQVLTGTEELEHVERVNELRETVRELLETPEQADDVISVSVFLGQPEAAGGRVSVPLSVQAIYRTESGGTASVGRRLAVESGMEMEPGSAARVMGVRSTEVYAAPAAGGLEIRLPVEITALVTKKVSLQEVKGLNLDMENPLSSAGRPSVTVVPYDGNDIWNIAKKYRTTPALISAANPDMPEKGMLLIPRTR